jgi:hypothetical protein
VNCDLLLNGAVVSQEDELYAGDYEVEMNFINPADGSLVESDLLSDAAFSLSVENDGDNQSVDGTKGNASLSEGEVILNAVAYLPGEVTLSNEKKYTVLPEPKTLDINVLNKKDSYSADDIASENEEILIKVTDSGSTLSENEWENTNIKINDSSELKWSVERGDDVSTWKLIPGSSDGSISGVTPGTFDITISADYQIDEQYAFGVTSMNFDITEYAGDVLLLELEEQPDKYTMDNLENEDGITVKAYIENKETGEKELIDEELWNSLTFSTTSKSKIAFTYEKGQEVGCYVAHPKYYKNDPLKTADGKINVTYKANGQAGERTYSGTLDGEINVEKLSKQKWLVYMAPKLIALAIILFILIGYIKKNRIKTKGLRPHNIYKSDVSGKKKIKKKVFSVIIPYVDEVAVVYCQNSGYKCYFPNLTIKATSKNTFRIQNGNIDVKTILINGAKVNDVKDIKKQRFSYSGFQITSIDTKNNNKKLGSFVFR